MGRYNEDYLNGLIAKAKKSWDGVDVDSFMNNLRDMETIKCKDLMYGDWCRNGHGFPMQITNVGEDYAYATFEGLEGDPWEFDDNYCQPSPIEITPELLGANGWKVYDDDFLEEVYPSFCYKEVNHLEWKCGTLSILIDYEKDNERVYSDIIIPCKYVHQLQQILRLAGMSELANNFKVK